MNFEEAIKRIENVLESTTFGVLATSNRNGVISACQMCIINDGLTVYFQTDKSFEKVKNISENPNVAINLGAFYFKGIAKIIGQPVSFPKFIDKIKNKHFETYKHYTNLPNEILIQVDLFECKIWGIDLSKNIHSQEVIQVVNLHDKTIKNIICDKI